MTDCRFSADPCGNNAKMCNDIKLGTKNFARFNYTENNSHLQNNKSYANITKNRPTITNVPHSYQNKKINDHNNFSNDVSNETILNEIKNIFIAINTYNSQLENLVTILINNMFFRNG